MVAAGVGIVCGVGAVLLGCAPADEGRVGRLVALLGSTAYEERRDAAEALNDLGAAALPALRRAAAGGGPEARRRARMLVQSIEGRRRDAAEFARQFLELAEVLEVVSVLGTPRGEWARRGIMLLFGHPGAGPVPPALAARLSKAERLRPAELEALLRDAHTHLARRGALSAEAAPERLIMRALRAVDLHAEWFDHARFGGCGGFVAEVVGLDLESGPAGGLPRVVTPVMGSPAYRAGLRAGDRLVAVSRCLIPEAAPQAWEHLPTRGLELEPVRAALLGREKALFRLAVERDGAAQLLELEVTGGAVARETVLGLRRRPDDTWDYLLDPQKRIAYVRLTGFGHTTAEELDRVLGRLEQVPLGGLVLDLRFNPGGNVAQAAEVAGLFLDGGLIFRFRRGGGKEAPFRATRPGRRLGVPLVCLVNGASAGGSEIVAAALQDYRRAPVVGERSRGRVSFQNIQPWEGAELKVTGAVALRPGGGKLDRFALPGRPADEWGVTPSPGYALSLSPAERAVLAEHLRQAEIIRRRDARPGPAGRGFEDRQLDLALRYLRSRARKA